MTLDILIRDYGLPIPRPVVIDNQPAQSPSEGSGVRVRHQGAGRASGPMRSAEIPTPDT